MQPTLLVHIAAGALALISGFVALYVAKGLRLHRKSGLLLVGAMVVMGLSGAGGAGLERCELCGTIYLRAWHEVYDDSWRYYSPVSDEEARAVVEAFREGRDEGERTVWRLVKERPALQQPPGGKGVAWIRRRTIVGGPSYDA